MQLFAIDTSYAVEWTTALKWNFYATDCILSGKFVKEASKRQNVCNNRYHYAKAEQNITNNAYVKLNNIYSLRIFKNALVGACAR